MHGGCSEEVDSEEVDAGGVMLEWMQRRQSRSNVKKRSNPWMAGAATNAHTMTICDARLASLKPMSVDRGNASQRRRGVSGDMIDRRRSTPAPESPVAGSRSLKKFAVLDKFLAGKR